MRVEMEGKHGRTRHGGPGDRGAWSEPPPQVARVWQGLGADARYGQLVERHPKVNRTAAPARRFAVLTVRG